MDSQKMSYCQCLLTYRPQVNLTFEVLLCGVTLRDDESRCSEKCGMHTHGQGAPLHMSLPRMA